MRCAIVIIAALMVSCVSNELKIAELNNPGGTNSGEPSFFKIDEHMVGLSWVEEKDEGATLKYAVYENEDWKEPQIIVSGEDWFVNWADFPGVVTNGDNWIAWFLQKSNTETFAYDVMITQSSNSGTTWSAPKKLHNDSTHTEHGFVSAVAARDGFELIWLDGRNSGGGHGAGAMTIRSAFVDFLGNISDRRLLDERTCDCCQTALANMSDNHFLALYRDRSTTEVRDIAAVSYKSSEKGKSGTLIYNDKWKIEGCPVNGPRVAIADNNEIGVAWFSMGEDKISKVQFATSIDEGFSFSEPIVLDTGNVGRVDVLFDQGLYYVSFIDEQPDGFKVKIVVVKEGGIVDSYSISKVSSSRKTGFPRMSLVDGGLLIAYTHEQQSKLITKKMYLN